MDQNVFFGMLLIVVCKMCDSQGPIMQATEHDEYDAIVAWNKRRQSN